LNFLDGSLPRFVLTARLSVVQHLPRVAVAKGVTAQASEYRYRFFAVQLLNAEK
jgi:hypothetical protein